MMKNVIIAYTFFFFGTEPEFPKQLKMQVLIM